MLPATRASTAQLLPLPAYRSSPVRRARASFGGLGATQIQTFSGVAASGSPTFSLINFAPGLGDDQRHHRRAHLRSKRSFAALFRDQQYLDHHDPGRDSRRRRDGELYDYAAAAGLLAQPGQALDDRGQRHAGRWRRVDGDKHPDAGGQGFVHLAVDRPGTTLMPSIFTVGVWGRAYAASPYIWKTAWR